jgi:hypothetical protein
MCGKIAFRKLEALAKPENLRRAFARINAAARRGDEARLTSCYATLVVVAKTLTNQPISKDKSAGLMRGVTPLVCQGQANVQTSEIMRCLDAGFLVGISLTFKKGTAGADDHHFAVFALDKETVVAAMAWEKHYDLTQWFLGRNKGIFTRDRFEELMKKIEDGDIRAVVDLCAFLGSSKIGQQTVPLALALRQDVNGCRPVSQAMALKLPSA